MFLVILHSFKLFYAMFGYPNYSWYSMWALARKVLAKPVSLLLRIRFPCSSLPYVQQHPFLLLFFTYIDVERRSSPRANRQVPFSQGNYFITQEVKNLKRPEFEANPDLYYPTETFKKMGLSRSQCKCGHYYWRASESQTTCGDSK